MSNTTFPGAVDTPLTNPNNSTDTLASVPHNIQHGFANDAIIALEQKLGSASGNNSPVTGSLLVGTATGISQWLTTLTSFSITTSFLDANGKTWIGQTATASAVNYLNVANSATTLPVTLSALGTDSNIDLNLVPKGSGKVRDNGSALIDFRSSFQNFIESGAVWTQNSGLVGSMTTAVLWINGVEYSPAAVSNHTFGASVDTYIDYTVGTGIVYTAVANNAAAPALAANSVRLAKVVTNSSAITSVTQTGVDSVFNPFRQLAQLFIGGSMLSNSLQSYTNGGSAGGTFYYLNLGGIKLVWGTTATITITGSGVQSQGYILNFPTSFFSTIQTAIGTMTGTASGTQYLYIAPNTTPTTTAWNFYLSQLSGTNGSGTASLFVIGT